MPSVVYPFDHSDWPFGLAQPGLGPGFVEVGVPVEANGTSVVASGDGWLVPFGVAAPTAFTTLSYCSRAHGASADWFAYGGIYEKNGTVYSLAGASPATALVADATIGTLTFAAPIAVNPGRFYYLALAFAGTIDIDDNGPQPIGINAKIGSAAAQAIFEARGFVATAPAIAPLPATIAQADLTAGHAIPWLYLA